MSRHDPGEHASPTVVFGCLFDVNSISSSREQLLLEMRPHVRIVLLEGSKGGRKALLAPWPQVMDEEDGVLRISNAFALSGRRKLRPVAAALAHLEGTALRLLLRRRGVDDYVIWLRTPGRGLERGRGPHHYLYDCMDPSFAGDSDPHYDAIEEAAVRGASLVFATAHTLFRRVSVWHDAVHLLPNATARAELAPAMVREGAFPKTVGYVGTVDARFDAAAVANAARRLPDWRFEIVGRVNDEAVEAMSAVTALPNVEVTGHLPEDEVVARMREFGIGLIPFTARPMNDAINSVKMFDYLAFGLPVVALDTEEARRNPFVSVASTSDALPNTIEEAWRTDDAEIRSQRRDWALANTWRQRADEALSIMAEAGLLTLHVSRPANDQLP